MTDLHGVGIVERRQDPHGPGEGFKRVRRRGPGGATMGTAVVVPGRCGGGGAGGEAALAGAPPDGAAVAGGARSAQGW
jgi:hypothetical protein